MSDLPFTQVNSRPKIHFSEPKCIIQRDGELNLKVWLQDLIKSYIKNLLKHWAKDHLTFNLRKGDSSKYFPDGYLPKKKGVCWEEGAGGLSWLAKQNNFDMLEHCGCHCTVKDTILLSFWNLCTGLKGNVECGKDLWSAYMASVNVSAVHQGGCQKLTWIHEDPVVFCAVSCKSIWSKEELGFSLLAKTIRYVNSGFLNVVSTVLGYPGSLANQGFAILNQVIGVWCCSC